MYNMEVVSYIVRLYLDGFLHSSYRVDKESEVWELQTKLRHKYGNRVTGIDVAEVIRHG